MLDDEKKRLYNAVMIGKTPARVKEEVTPENRFSITQSRNAAKSVLEIYRKGIHRAGEGVKVHTSNYSQPFSTSLRLRVFA
jgi:hypothetical protein